MDRAHPEGQAVARPGRGAGGKRAPARRSAGGDGPPHELVARLARLSFDGAEGEALAGFGAGRDPGLRRRRRRRRCGAGWRSAARRCAPRSTRAEGKLGNQGFVANAPGDVVEAEREKLAAYRAELEELG